MDDKIELALQDTPEEDLVLTTIDNPYNPKEDYAKWRRWDVDNEYHTEAFLARMIDFDGLVDVDDELNLSIQTNKVIHEILEHDVMGIYKLI